MASSSVHRPRWLPAVLKARGSRGIPGLSQWVELVAEHTGKTCLGAKPVSNTTGAWSSSDEEEEEEEEEKDSSDLLSHAPLFGPMLVADTGSCMLLLAGFEVAVLAVFPSYVGRLLSLPGIIVWYGEQ